MVKVTGVKHIVAHSGIDTYIYVYMRVKTRIVFHTPSGSKSIDDPRIRLCNERLRSIIYAQKLNVIAKLRR